MAAARGRPTSYKPEYAETAKKLCDDGATDADLADFFSVTINTIGNWARANPEFLGALKVGKQNADDRVKRSLYQKAVGYTFDAVKIFMPAGAKEPVVVPYREHVPPSDTAGIFWLKNRDKDNWRERQEVTGADGGPIHTETKQTVDVTGLNADQLRALASIKVPAG